jgi:GNAT superfamily N-acetyltransferase
VTTIRALASTDDRKAFRCGNDDLDRFFHRFAGQNQFRHYVGVSYVAVADDGRLLGYATVSAASIEIDRLPATARKKLPLYPLPVVRLARLAVDENAQGLGVGKALLRYVFRLAVETSRTLGCVGIVVDAKPTAVTYYAGFGFMPLDVLEGASDARPEPTAMFLDLRDVLAAVSSSGDA